MQPKLITAKNVNHALSEGFWHLRTSGRLNESRNGPVVVAPGPVLTTYKKPRERVLFSSERNANPFFHLLECIWMMAGRRDADWIQQFNARMAEYAEPDGKIWGAYGHRWDRHFEGINQVKLVADMLAADHTTRRAVIAMWDPRTDIWNDKRDVPCNTQIYFDGSNGVLDMTVCCRSNDALWGAYGANAVHMSFLQEVVAAGAGLPVGEYTQMSNNFHAYTDVKMAADFLQMPPAVEDTYAFGVPVLDIMQDNDVFGFMQQCGLFCMGKPTDNAFLESVARPMYDYYLRRKEPGANIFLETMPHCDWRVAALAWHGRNIAK